MAVWLGLREGRRDGWEEARRPEGGLRGPPLAAEAVPALVLGSGVAEGDVCFSLERGALGNLHHDQERTGSLGLAASGAGGPGRLPTIGERAGVGRISDS